MPASRREEILHAQGLLLVCSSVQGEGSGQDCSPQPAGNMHSPAPAAALLLPHPQQALPLLQENPLNKASALGVCPVQVQLC